MITETSTKNELLTAIDEAISELVGIVSPMDENMINKVPYKDSWTPGQLFRHVTKSMYGMTNAMQKESKPAERDPGERIAGLQKAFLDFSNKFNAPEFIVPEEGTYEKEATIKALTDSVEQFKENANKANLNEIVEGLPLSTITKLEILHFVLYHTQRHLHQMKKIAAALKAD